MQNNKQPKETPALSPSRRKALEYVIERNLREMQEALRKLGGSNFCVLTFDRPEEVAITVALCGSKKKIKNSFYHVFNNIAHSDATDIVLNAVKMYADSLEEDEEEEVPASPAGDVVS